MFTMEWRNCDWKGRHGKIGKEVGRMDGMGYSIVGTMTTALGTRPAVAGEGSGWRLWLVEYTAATPA